MNAASLTLPLCWKEYWKSPAHLENQPRFGAVEPLLKHKKLQYRYLVAFSYKVIYRVDEDNDKVVVSRVFHASRSPKKLKGI